MRYYLDFCYKYHFSAKDKDSLEHFIKKLHEKNQTTEQQKQAADAVDIYYELLESGAATHILQSHTKNEHPRKKTDAITDKQSGNPWESIFDCLRAEIKVRQYSPKTLQTYAGWTRKFQYFTKNKHPDSLTVQDVKDYLTYLAVKRKVAASTQKQAFNSFADCNDSWRWTHIHQIQIFREPERFGFSRRMLRSLIWKTSMRQRRL